MPRSSQLDRPKATGATPTCRATRPLLGPGCRPPEFEVGPECDNAVLELLRRDDSTDPLSAEQPVVGFPGAPAGDEVGDALGQGLECLVDVGQPGPDRELPIELRLGNLGAQLPASDGVSGGVLRHRHVQSYSRLMTQRQDVKA